MSALDTPIGFLATDKPEASIHFYRALLGLNLDSDEPFAVVFHSGDVQIRIQKLEQFDPPPYTVFGWDVNDIEAAIDELAGRGIAFEKFPHFDQDERGIWDSPSGARVAWFKDPCGQMLSLTQAAGSNS